jgi:hypothetical protein
MLPALMFAPDILEKDCVQHYRVRLPVEYNNYTIAATIHEISTDMTWVMSPSTTAEEASEMDPFNN